MSIITNNFYRLKSIKETLIDIHKSDPVKYCNIYKESGCSHVDGMLCNMKTCNINKNDR